jgi:two-component system phosphate regulon sensor histidine kinase PhoR
MNEPRQGLSRRLLTVYAVAFLAIIGLFGALVDRLIREQFLDDLTGSLVRQAAAAQLVIGGEEDLAGLVNQLADRLGSRVSVIALDGRVLADSAAEAATMENHADRPEVISALSGEVGIARRHSATLDEALLYVALPPDRARIVRMAVPERAVAGRLGEARTAVITGAALAGLIGIVLVAVIARRIALPLQQMTAAAEAAADGELSVRVPRADTRELDRMAQALNNMASQLGRRIEASEAQSRLLDQVLAGVRQGVIVIDEDDQVLYVNPAAAGMVRIPDALRELTPHGLQTLVRDARAQGTIIERRFDHGTPVRVLQATATPFPDDRRALLTLSDVTDATRLEATRRDFVASASHELKTPVSAILASAEALQLALERDPGSARRFGEQIERSARQLAGLVGDLLDLSRLETSSFEATIVRLDQIVEEEAGRFQAKAGSAGLTLVVTTVPVSIAGSHEDLGLAIRNLLDNAIRHTPDGGEVGLRVAVDGDQALIEVSDNGEGIPRRELPRIFERFYRVDAARSRATGGTGLGLAIVRHVVERNAGSVTVESELGVGTTFRLRFPLA